MKDTIKMAVSHFFIITVCVMSVIGISNIFVPGFSGYPADFPLTVLLVGASSALPSLLFYFRSEPTRGRFIRRVVLHFICIMTIVLGEGGLLGWYDTLPKAAVIAGFVILVYLTVWIITRRMDMRIEEGINQALSSFNENEQ